MLDHRLDRLKHTSLYHTAKLIMTNGIISHITPPHITTVDGEPL